MDLGALMRIPDQSSLPDLISIAADLTLGRLQPSFQLSIFTPGILNFGI
jgi:hypothetical protein